MPVAKWWTSAREVPGAPRVRGRSVTAEEWREGAADVAAAGGRLLALWASSLCGRRSNTAMAAVEPAAPAGAAQARGAAADAAYAAYLTDRGVLILELPVSAQEIPALEEPFPCAARMQRAMFDVSGVRASGPDRRPWLRHGPQAYEFVRVAGEGVHEIAVGPIHAGTIEPGHFRFSAVGEKVLRLETRLGFTHKGVERRFTELPLLDAHRLAARVCGDSAVAYSWAYCQALEGMAGCTIPPRATALRALLLELERMANHLGDIGALANDAGFAFGLVQFSRLKETLLRAQAQALGQRYLLDAVVPGGTRTDLSGETAQQLAACIGSIALEAGELRAIYDDHAGLRDRFSGSGTLAPALAARLGVLGLAGRASGQALDARVDLPWPPYDALAPVKVVRHDGDVGARVAVRFDELAESCRLVRMLLAQLPPGPHVAGVHIPAQGGFGVGLIEGWRGPVFLALEAGAGGAIQRCHPHDPSWQNWPAVEHAALDNLVPDFPLINKSFNLAYSGVDL